MTYVFLLLVVCSFESAIQREGRGAEKLIVSMGNARARQKIDFGEFLLRSGIGQILEGVAVLIVSGDSEKSAIAVELIGGPVEMA